MSIPRIDKKCQISLRDAKPYAAGCQLLPATFEWVHIHLSHVSEGEKHQPKCLRNHQQVNLDLPLASWEGATPDDDHEPTKNEGKRGVKPAFKKE